MAQHQAEAAEEGEGEQHALLANPHGRTESFEIKRALPGGEDEEGKRITATTVTKVRGMR